MHENISFHLILPYVMSNIFSATGDIEMVNGLDDETDELKEGIVCIYKLLSTLCMFRRESRKI